MKSINRLKEEHRIIERGMDLLRYFCAQLSHQQCVASNDLSMLLDFFRDFADKWHHGKEEEVFFPFLIKKDNHLEQGPVAMMLHEHEQGRNYLAQMRQAMQQAKWEVFLEAASEYLTLLSAHIQKEEQVLFQIATIYLDNDSDEQLWQQYHHLEEAMGEAFYSHYAAVITALEERYLGSKE